MNDSITYQASQNAKTKGAIKRHQILFVASTAACAVFVVCLVSFASRQTQIMGLCVLATMTLLTSLAAFFKAYDRH
jgi:putative flippase GtrA